MPTDTFNLPAPPGFRGLHPDLPIRCYQRNLPHWRQEGATYAVTFRLADSIPQEQLRALQRWRTIWEREHPEPRTETDWQRLAGEISRKTEAWMDKGYGECVFRDRELANELSKSLLHFQDQRCVTSCFTVMPNHVHVVMKPLGAVIGRVIPATWRRVKTGQLSQGTNRHPRFCSPELQELHDGEPPDHGHNHCNRYAPQGRPLPAAGG